MGKRTSYKGLALSAGGQGQLLYATDFNNGRVDVFASTFHPVALSTGAFTDPDLQGFGPFGIQAIGGDIYVTYAKQDRACTDEVAGPGLGYVDVYAPRGKLIRRVRRVAPQRAMGHRVGAWRVRHVQQRAADRQFR